MANEYKVGKGKVFFDRFVEGTQAGLGFVPLGNAPAFTLNRSGDTLDHFSSEGGIRTKDDSITLEMTSAGSITVDNISAANLALAFSGVVLDIAATSAASVIETFPVRKGSLYQLGASPSIPSGVRKATVATVTSSGPVTYTAGTDFVADVDLGTIFIPLTSTIPNGTAITVTYARAASTRQQVASSDKQVEGAIKFHDYSPRGVLRDWFLPWVRLTTNGDVNLISDEWMSLSFSIEALKKGDLATLYIDGRAA